MGRHSDSVSLIKLENLLKVPPDPYTLWCTMLTFLKRNLYAGNFPYLVILSITKISVLFFYLRLFGTPGTHQGFQKLLYTTQALVVAWLIASALPAIFRCRPIDDTWNPLVVGAPDVGRYCDNDNTYYVSTSAFNVALDFWIVVLPLSIICSSRQGARSA